jgi:crossover junction endodeoxyribonuclease RuvC
MRTDGPMMILSLDLSLNSTGYCIWDNTPVHVGLITNPVGGEMSPKLIAISQAISQLITQYNPSCLVLEDTYVGPNAKTVTTLAKVHGAVLLTAAQANIPVMYISGPSVKKALGCKKKAQVFQKICEMFPETTNGWVFSRDDDRSDSIAIAIAYQRKSAET